MLFLGNNETQVRCVRVRVVGVVSCRVVLCWGEPGQCSAGRYCKGWLSHSIGDLAVQRRDSRRLAPSRLGRALTHICRYGDGGWHLFHGRSSTRTRTMSVVETMLHHGRTAPQPPGWEAAARPSVSGQGRAASQAAWPVLLSVCLLCPAPFYARSLCPRTPMGESPASPGAMTRGRSKPERCARACFCPCALPVLVCV